MSVKETVVNLIVSAGYDSLTACEMYEEAKKRFLDSGDKERTFHIKGGGSYTLRRN